MHSLAFLPSPPCPSLPDLPPRSNSSSPKGYGVGRGEAMCAYECTFTKPALGIQVKDNAEGQIYITQMNPDVRAATNAKGGDEVTAINGISLVGLGTAEWASCDAAPPGKRS